MYWQQIYYEIAKPNINLVYIAIGCAMNKNDYPNGVDDKNNQQYPPFIKKFIGNKVIILIDPNLEKDLVIQKFVNSPTIMQENKVRIIKDTTNTIFAINDTYDFLYYPNDNKENDKTAQDIAFIYELINICLSKINKTKVILQDFSGRDTTTFYLELLNIFEKDNIINNVIFDVTQDNGNCYIEMHENNITLINNNIVQEKFLLLKDTISLPLHTKTMKERINYVIHPISWNFVNLKLNPTFQIDTYYNNKIVLMFTIYSIPFNEYSSDRTYLIAKYELLIRTILTDIVETKELDKSVIIDLMDIIYDRNLFIKAMQILNYQ
jgi:hypothetical protein